MTSDQQAEDDVVNPALTDPVSREGAVTVRSQERLRVATETVMAGRARLVKYVVTEDVTYTVPVSREEVRLEVERLPEHDQVAVATVPPDAVHEVVLHEERVFFTKQAVAVERVRMVKQVHTSDQVVTGAVRVEHVDVEHVSGMTDPR